MLAPPGRLSQPPGWLVLAPPREVGKISPQWWLYSTTYGGGVDASLRWVGAMIGYREVGI